MGHCLKYARRKKDRITGLPDDILSTIVSFVSLKDAVNTSCVSKKWRFIWITHPNILLNCDTIFGNQSFSDSDYERRKQNFVKDADDIMEQRKGGSKIDSLAIHFHLGKDSTSNIDRWIASAVSRGAENIDIDLSAWNDIEVHDVTEPYTFPFWHILREDCRLKHLKLASCNLAFIQSSIRISSLVTVELRGSKISDEQMQNLLYACSYLVNLTIHRCTDLVAIKFAGTASFSLKFLSIKHCSGLETVEISAKNLCTLEYSGEVIDFFFRGVPKLVHVFLGFYGLNGNGRMTSTVEKFAYLPQLESLNFVSILADKDVVSKEFPTFTNISELVLTVFPFHDEDELHWISFLLRSFPYLNKLQLNLFCPSFVRSTRRIGRKLRECPHMNLKELEINGFNWNKHEKDLLKYLTKNGVGLEKVVINQSPKLYKGFNEWVYDDKSCFVEFNARHRQLLRAAVPLSVRLEIH